jgi:hypothetical protein
MVKFTQSMKAWLSKFHPELIVPLMFGHLELFTEEMKREYIEWCQTDEGSQYLQGGAKYVEG